MSIRSLKKAVYSICEVSGLFRGHYLYDGKTSSYLHYSKARLSVLAKLFRHAGWGSPRLHPFRFDSRTENEGKFLMYNAFWGKGPLWISAHYDYFGGVGALDNATSLAVMLELSRSLPSHLKSKVTFVSWGAEEHSLQGSLAFVRTIPEVAKTCQGLVNLECLGLEHTGIVTRTYETMLSDPDLVKLLKETNPTYSLVESPTPFWSDHVSFRHVKVPFVELMGYGEDQEIIHTCKDIPKYVGWWSNVEEAAETLVKFVKRWDTYSLDNGSNLCYCSKDR